MPYTIDDYKRQYAEARLKNDATGMQAANDGANAIRRTLGQAEEKADVDIAYIQAIKNKASGATPVVAQPEKPSYNSKAIIGAIKNNANATYNQQANSLKNRVAGIISKYTSQLNGLESQYRPVYQQNDQAKYQTDEATKAILARSGLLGSGIQIGNVKQDEMNYNMATQGIDLQKQKEESNINNAIIEAENNKETELANLALQRDQQINQGIIDEMRYARDIEREDFYRDREYGLQQDKLQFEKDSFDATMNYNYAGLQQSREQFEKQYGLEQSKFEFDKEFANKEFTEKTRQFDAQFGFEKEKFSQSMRLEGAKLAAQMSMAKMDNALARERMTQEKYQFGQEMSNVMRDFTMKEKEMYMAENDRIDGILMRHQADGTLTPEFVQGLIQTSRLSGSMKEAKMKMMTSVYAPIDTDEGYMVDFSSNGGKEIQDRYR